MSNQPISSMLTLAQCRKRNRRLVSRIFKAWQKGQFRHAENLLRMSLNSLSATILAVDEVANRPSATTPGSDGVIWDNSFDRNQAIRELQRTSEHKALPVRRIYIDKGNGQNRPLGIPAMQDRVMQHKLISGIGLIAEQLADEHSYAYRKGRSAGQAIRVIIDGLKTNKNDVYVLDADITAFFDNLSHDFLLSKFPLQTHILSAWLKAGYVHDGDVHPSLAGVPQGSLIGPVLGNLALDGLEGLVKSICPDALIARYADDVVVAAESEAALCGIRDEMDSFLAERGLWLSAEKTQIRALDQGFDFLGAHIVRTSMGVVAKPSPKSEIKLIKRLETLLSQPEPDRWVRAQKVRQCILSWAAYHGTYLDNTQMTAVWQWIQTIVRQLMQVSAEGTKGADAHLQPSAETSWMLAEPDPEQAGWAWSDERGTEYEL